jgi:hypothetical protein
VEEEVIACWGDRCGKFGEALSRHKR